MHDKGNEENIFDRVDYQFNTDDSLHLNLEFTRSWFQTPNSYDSAIRIALVRRGGGYRRARSVRQSRGPTDQRSQDRNVQHRAHLDAPDQFQRRLNPRCFRSPATSTTIIPAAIPSLTSARRTCSRKPARPHANKRRASLRALHVKGIHNIKAGVTYEQTFLTEHDNLGIVDPTLNAPCLDANGAPVSSAIPRQHSGAAGRAATNPLVSGAVRRIRIFSAPRLLSTSPNRRVADSDGCPADKPTAGLLPRPHGRKRASLYVQDTITKGNWNFNLGIRGDIYNGLPKPRKPNRGWALHTTSSRPTPFYAFPMREHSKRHSTKTWCFPASVARIPRSASFAAGEGCAPPGATHTAWSGLPQ